MWMTITAPDVNGSSELCFLFLPANAAVLSQSGWGAQWEGGGGVFLRRRRLKKKIKGVKNQNGNDICHQRRPAPCQPLMRLFFPYKWACDAADLHCKCAAHRPFSQVCRRATARFPHTPQSVIPPPDGRPTPPPPGLPPLTPPQRDSIAVAVEAVWRRPGPTPLSGHTQWGLCSSSKAWGGCGSVGGDAQLWQAVG